MHIILACCFSCCCKAMLWHTSSSCWQMVISSAERRKRTNIQIRNNKKRTIYIQQQQQNNNIAVISITTVEITKKQRDLGPFRVPDRTGNDSVFQIYIIICYCCCYPDFFPCFEHIKAALTLASKMRRITTMITSK